MSFLLFNEATKRISSDIAPYVDAVRSKVLKPNDLLSRIHDSVKKNRDTKKKG